MKIESVSLYNFSKYSKITVNFNENITYLIGGNGAGKSTLGITAIWFVLCGIAEKQTKDNPLIGERFRFIGPAGAKAQGQIIFKDEKTGNLITCTRTLSKTGSTLEIKGELPGIELNQEWLTSLFNEFLIAPKRFQDLSPLEQAKAIGIDTVKFDKEIAELKQKATTIRGIIKSMGDITPVAPAQNINIQELTTKRSDAQNRLNLEKKSISDQLNNKYLENKEANKKLREEWENKKRDIDNQVTTSNAEFDRLNTIINNANTSLTYLRSVGYDGNEVTAFIDSIAKQLPAYLRAHEMYPLEPVYINELPDNKPLADFEERAILEIASIDKEITNANTNNQNAFLYSEYLKKVDAKKEQEKQLEQNLQDQKTKEQDKISYIKSFDLPFDGMGIDDDGGLTYMGRYIREPYFSSGECLKIIVTLMSRKNPELKYVFLQDFQLMDEDRQKQITDSLESLGFQLVVEYVGKAKITDKTCILLKDCSEVDSYEEIKKDNLL